MGGRASPAEGPERPLVCPSLPRDSGLSSRLRFGGCFAAEDRLRRWPDEAAKAFGEARAKELQRGEEAARNEGGPLRVACHKTTRRAGRPQLGGRGGARNM